MSASPDAAPARWVAIAPGNQAAAAIDDVRPRFRAQPATAQELADTLREATDQHLAVAPLGGGTHLALGNPPRRLDLLLETRGLARVIEYEPADLTVTVEAGIPLGELQALLRGHGQFLALDPPTRPEATIGGVVATNASGPLRFAYGTARDLVLGTRAANADGSLTHAGGRVVKNVAGYDLNKLYTGSLGTLGVLVELSFKLAPVPPARALVVGQFADLGAARAFLGAVLHSPLSPLALELLRPSAAERVGLPRSDSVVVRVGGYPRAVERQARDLGAMLRQHAGQPVDADEAVWDAVESLALRAPGELLVRAAAPVAQSATLVELLERRLAPFAPLAWAHAGNGVAYAACAAPAEGAASLERALAESRRAVAGLDGNGSLVIERCPTSLKRELDVWGDPGDGQRLMRALKQQLDPRATLNPGRYVAGL